MERKIVSGIMLSLLFIGILTLAFNVQPARAEPNTTVYLVPSEIILYTNEVSVGYRFNVTAWVSNVADLFAYQAALYYNASVIDMTNAWIPTWDSDWVFYGHGIPLGPCLYYFDSWGYGLIGFSGLGGATPPFNGNGTLAVFEFEIIASPQDGSLTSPLIISEIPSGIPFEQAFETKLKNWWGPGDPIEFTATDGHYLYMPPPPPPSYNLTIYSSPSGVTFTVDGVSRTTPWSGNYIEGASVSLVMPETHDGYVWSHWLEDGDTNRTKTVTLDINITLTGVFTPLAVLADLNKDGKVDIDDVVLVALSFGSYPEHPRWNPIADLTKDEKVDIDDVVLVAIYFGELV